MVVRAVVVALIAALAGPGAAGAASAQTDAARGQLHVTDVPGLGWIDRYAAPFEDGYADQLTSACPAASELTTVRTAPAVDGTGTQLGDRLARGMTRIETVRLADADQARRAFTQMASSPPCLAYAADHVLSGVLSSRQYPTRPPLPTLAPAVSDTDGLLRLDFTGRATIGPFAGALLAVRVDDAISLAAVRVHNPLGAEVNPVVDVVAPAFRYEAAVAAGPAPDQRQMDALARVTARVPAIVTGVTAGGVADATAQPFARQGAPTMPPACRAVFDAYAYSGQHAATAGTTVRGAGGQFQLQLETFAFPGAAEAKRYVGYFADAAGCTGAVWAAPGTPSAAVVRSPAKAGTTARHGCAVTYTTSAEPTATVAPVRGLGVVAVGDRAATFTTTTSRSTALTTTKLCRLVAAALA
jgi:hypothetical protein